MLSYVYGWLDISSVSGTYSGRQWRGSQDRRDGIARQNISREVGVHCVSPIRHLNHYLKQRHKH